MVLQEEAISVGNKMTPEERAMKYIPGATQTLSKGPDRFIRA